MDISKEYLNDIFEYNTGFLYWKKKTSRKVVVGKKAGTFDKRPSMRRYFIIIKRKRYLSSRLIFLYHNGYLPEQVDHKDRDTTNDRIENLRPATRSQNSRNMSSRRGSSSKYLGVNFHIRHKKWQAQIQSDGKQIYLGYFNTEDEAGKVYNDAAKLYHGEFANLNIINDRF